MVTAAQLQSHRGALSRDLGNKCRWQTAKVVLVALHKLGQVVEERSVVNAHPLFPIVTVELKTGEGREEKKEVPG